MTALEREQQYRRNTDIIVCIFLAVIIAAVIAAAKNGVPAGCIIAGLAVIFAIMFFGSGYAKMIHFRKRI